jgi:succinate dehydrogenase flavin-adding protein (antitoxin of CptAB toxin-antitoxin module)
MSVDLDIDNYNLEDILSLFKVPLNFNKEDLKTAKKMTLMTHPDKSGLDKDYFLFYSKAYKKLHGIYTFRQNTKQNLDIEYSDVLIDYETRDINKEEQKKKKEFNTWFNKTFEELNENKTDGYSEWLKSNDNELSKNINESKTKEEKEKVLMQKRKEQRELTIYKDIEETCVNLSVNSSSLSKHTPSDYGNNELFSKSGYQDLKSAYENTLIPVTDNDYNEKKQFKNTFELQQYRKENEVTMNDSLKSQQEKYIANRRKMADNEATMVGWDLANEIEQSEKKNQEFMSKFSLLKYK